MEVAFPHGEVPNAVKVIVTKPGILSAALGVYVAVVNEVGFVKVPVPLDDHNTLVLFVADEPAVILTADDPLKVCVGSEQVVVADPALAVGPADIVNIFEEVALLQGELPVAVKVKLTLPAEISAALELYVAVVSEVAFANVPVPLEVHKPPVLLKMDDPAVIFTAPVFEQVVIAVPAVAAAGALMLMVLIVLTDAQPPGASEVKVSVMVPVKVPTGV